MDEVILVSICDWSFCATAREMSGISAVEREPIIVVGT